MIPPIPNFFERADIVLDENIIAEIELNGLFYQGLLKLKFHSSAQVCLLLKGGTLALVVPGFTDYSHCWRLNNTTE